MTPDHPLTNPLLPALDPATSAVVEACAGSGKTWLLVSRLLRLLLAGVAPGALLAITFTRKAAEEMRARLDDWLRDLALLPDDEALAFLQDRGLTQVEAEMALPRARDLLETVLQARPGPMITTFHGWFFHLLEHAPLSQRIAGAIIEHSALLREEAWFEFTRELGQSKLGQNRGNPAERAFAELVAEHPLPTVRGLLNTLLAQRAEWWAYQSASSSASDLQPDSAIHQACTALEAHLGLKEDDDPIGELFGQPGFFAHLEEYAVLLGQEATALKNEAKRAVNMELARTYWHGQPVLAFDSLCACLLTGGNPRSLKLTGTMQDRLGALASRYVELHYLLAEDVQRTLSQLADQRALRLNRLVLTAGQAYLRTYHRLKTEQGGLDFTDAELEVARLLEDEVNAAAVFMKLDARWQHLLLDEFQDTNPLQWRILRAWLDAYGADSDRPTVFLVGDPKQSIYRFRRADPRLFPAAAEWLRTHYNARSFPQNETRRCAPAVVAWVNAVFENRPDYPAFSAHTAHQRTLPGQCECFIAPIAAACKDTTKASADDGTDAPANGIVLRNPLTTPPSSAPAKRLHEAAWVAQRIQDIVGQLVIHDSPPRPARYGDITVLYAKRAEIDVFEAAFKAVGIPFVTDRRGELLNTLEAKDLTALLTCLVDNHDDLALAHALKSPVFGFSDDDLLTLAARAEDSWWHRLMAWAALSETPPAVLRAAALLANWKTLAGVVPVHDLLDLIYHQANVSAHYAGAVPVRMRASVLANIEGFLALSLSLSGGRYPSLPRFLDELRQLREKAGQEGPDEAPAASADRIRMLTIHSAKGLESPIVFLIKADGGKDQNEGYGALMDWPPTVDHPEHFSIYGPKAFRGPGRDALFAAEQTQADIEKLNLLYVAMTRARQALFVSGVSSDAGAGAGAGANESKSESDGSWLGQLSTALTALDSSSLPGMPAVVRSCEAAPPTNDIAPRPVFNGTVGQRHAPERAETTFGIQLHAWLEQLTQGTPETHLRTTYSATHAATPSLADTLANTAQQILSNPDLAAAFNKAQHLNAHNELEFIDVEGRSSRIDRLVEFADEVWVLDYKTGGLSEPNLAERARPHLDQMQRYQHAAQNLYPGKSVRTVLVFADGQAFWPAAPGQEDK